MKRIIIIVMGVLMCFICTGAAFRITILVPDVSYTNDPEMYDEKIDVSAQIEYITTIQKALGDIVKNSKALKCKSNLCNYRQLIQDLENQKVAYQKLGTYTYAEWRMLAVTADYEASGCGFEHKSYVCQVVLNRCADERFNDDIYGNLIRPKQYNPIYVKPSSAIIREKACPEGWVESLEAARTAMMGLVDMPYNVIFQSEFSKLGTGNWKTIEPSVGSTTYFNYG